MIKRPFRFALPLLISCAAVTAVYAGGWAIITLNEMPDYAVAGKSLTLTFSVRQHGVTLLAGLQPTVQAAMPGSPAVKPAVTPGDTPGEYRAALTLPQAGEWTITINSGFN